MSERPISITALVQRNYDRERRAKHIAKYGKPLLETVIRDPAPVEQWQDSKLIAIRAWCMVRERWMHCDVGDYFLCTGSDCKMKAVGLS